MAPNQYAELHREHKTTALKLRESGIASRVTKLKGVRKWIIRNQDRLESAIYQDLKKPPEEFRVTELFPVLTELKHAIHDLKKWQAPQSVNGSLTFLGTTASLHYEPLGTTLIISPWNYPLLLALGPLISAIAAGNTVILKPSEFTPNINGCIQEMIHQLFDRSEIQLIQGAVKESSELLSLAFDHIFFTGSPGVGKIVMTAAAKNLTSVTLELGGKSPTIIDESASIKTAAKRIAWGKWTNAGQTCVAPDYIFVHQSKFEEFVKHLQNETENRYAEASTYTSIINSDHFKRLEQTLEDSLAKGAKVLFGGQRSELECRFQPTVITDVSDDMLIMQEEIFGPILPLLSYSDLNEVIQFINERPKPLALYHYSNSSRNKKRVKQMTTSGSLVFNDSVLQFGHPHLPMGGVNNSGLGKAHGKAGFLAFSHAKSIMHQRSGRSISSFVYPPYTGFKKKIIDLMLRYF